MSKVMRGAGIIEEVSLQGIGTVVIVRRGRALELHGEARMVREALVALFSESPIGKRVGYRREGSMLLALLPAKRSAKRARKGLFVANADGTYHCAKCIPKGVDVGDPEVEVWNEYSEGWLAPCVCSGCELSIPVYVNGSKEVPR